SAGSVTAASEADRVRNRGQAGQEQGQVIPPEPSVEPTPPTPTVPVTMSSSQILEGVKRQNPNADLEAARQLLGDKQYELKEVPVNNLTAPYGKVSEGKVSEYATREAGTQPPVVVNGQGEVIDGKHRLEAAQARGDETIRVWQPVETGQQPVPLVEQ